MPAERQEAIAAIASSRGGSMIPNRPSSVNPAATSAKISSRWSSAAALAATASTRCPRCASSSIRRCQCRGIKRPVAALGAGEGADGEDALGGALHVDEPAALVVVVQRGHEPVFGLERDRVRARALLALEVEVQPSLDADRQQRALGRVAVHDPMAGLGPAKCRLVAQHRRPDRLHEQRPAPRLHLARRARRNTP